jgi:putative heme-binding domain-containing protein
MLPQPCGTAVWRSAAKVLSAGLALMLPLMAQNDLAKIAGNAASGKVAFDSKGGCVACHSIGDRGASLGPDLGAIGIARSVKSLRLALVDPDAEIDREYFTVVIETKRGQTIRGLALNEDDLSIQVRDIDGNPRSFLKDDLKSTRRVICVPAFGHGNRRPGCLPSHATGACDC